MSIKDRLARLDSTKEPPAQQTPEVEDWILDLQRELDIKVLREEKSFILLKENIYPLYQEPYFAALRTNGFEVNYLHRITSDLPAAPLEKETTTNLKHALFIDTETTGLAGGTGTYPFLIGVGHLELDHIVVRQYLLPDFGHEWLMLTHLERLLRDFQFTVSFNGKSFDIPLLKNRFILNRMMTVLEDISHVDVLHAARRIWRLRLPACDLQSLEKHILQKHRIGDIPGELIPQIYFEFIRKREALHLRDVLEHNYHDIVNMVLLTIKIAAICESPVEHLIHEEDQFSLAKYYFQNKQYDESILLLENIVENSTAIEKSRLRNQAMFLLSMVYKKIGQPGAAKQHLQKLLENQVYDPAVIEELAKFYEHEDKDFACAKEVVEKGLQYLETIRQLDMRSDLLKYIPQLKHRQQRILRKLSKHSSPRKD